MADDPQSGQTPSDQPAGADPAAADPNRNQKGQWRPGVSGSPGGMRRWRRELQREITEQWADKVPYLMMSFYAYTLRAMKNNSPHAVAAFRECMDRIAGKVPQRIIEEKGANEAANELWSNLTEDQLDEIIKGEGTLPEDVLEQRERTADG